jgi:hypothetical protein
MGTAAISRGLEGFGRGTPAPVMGYRQGIRLSASGGAWLTPGAALFDPD